MASNVKKSFIMYNSYAEQISLLTVTERGELLTAIYEYVETGKTEMVLSGAAAMAFSFIRSNLDRDNEEYIARCEQNSINGKKGGRPKKVSDSVKTERFFEKAKKADNDNGNDIENDIDIDNGNGNGNGNGIDNEMHDIPAPLPVTPPPTAPLTQEEKNKLLSMGMPAAYIERRQARAADYGKAKGKSAYNVLLSWWEKDGGSKPQSQGSCWDDDEFFKLKYAMTGFLSELS